MRTHTPGPGGQPREGTPPDGAPSRPGVPAFDPWRFRLALVTVASTLVLIFVGGLVTSTGSGLSVPDWPLSYGMLMPPLVGGVRFEHGHRMAATVVGFLAFVLAVWTAVRETRREVVVLAWASLATVVAQGVLGGLTVILLLPTSVSVAHACLAQTFFCLVIALAYTLSREWLDASPRRSGRALRTTSLVVFGLVYLQLILGAVMRHIDARDWAGGGWPDFPLSRVIPDSLPEAVHLGHRLNALLILGAVGRLFAECQRLGDRRFKGNSGLLLLLVLLQAALGAETVWSGRAVLPTTLHVMMGATVLGTSFWLTLRAFRLLQIEGLDTLGSLEQAPSHP